MSTKRYLGPAAIVLLLAAVAIALRGRGQAPATPDEAVIAMFRAAKEGDAAAYLAVLTGPLRASTEATQAQLGSAEFAASLRRSMTGVKGYAVSASGEPTDNLAALDIELSFADRNERQRFTLVREGDGWLVARIDKADAIQPPIPYDAPVFDTSATKD